MEEEITIILHIPGKDPFPVVVNSHSTSSVLEAYVGDDNPHTFIFRDIPMCPSFTFKWFGINNGTDIYVFPNNPEPQIAPSIGYRRSHSSHTTPIEHYLPNSEFDKPKYRKKLQTSFEAPTFSPSFNPKLEDAKMKDQYFRKVEGSAICYRKILKRFSYIENNRILGQRIDSPTVLSDTAPSNPSTDELPTFWDDDQPMQNLSSVQSPISP